MKKSILILFFAIFAFATISVSANEVVTDVNGNTIEKVEGSSELADNSYDYAVTDVNGNTITYEVITSPEALHCKLSKGDVSVECWFCKCKELLPILNALVDAGDK